MSKLGQLPVIVEETLGGLRADDRLYQRVLSGERRAATPRARMPLVRAVALACSVVFVFGMGALGLNALLTNNEQGMPRMETRAAGAVPEGGTLSADVPQGSIVLGKSADVPGYRGVWARSTDGNFPLIRAGGAFYRLLTSPKSIGQNLLGSSLGTVAVFTEEPSLDASNALLSNVAAEGTPVYAIRGMEGSAVAAMVEGTMRAFQRVSYSGNALLGGEGLAATLSGQVVGLQLSGVGTISDADQAQSLMNTLFSGANYQSAATRTTDQALLITYGNGLVLQMAVQDNNLIACGTWNCAPFLEAFRQTAGQ